MSIDEPRIVPEDCRLAAISALWAAISAVPGCHVEHVAWDRQTEQPYQDSGLCYLREAEWRRDQVLIIHHFGWTPSFHRSHHEIGLELPDTEDPEAFAAKMVADISGNIERQRRLARKAHRAGIALPLDHQIIDHIALDVMHLLLIEESELQDEISSIRQTILDLIAECTKAENSDYDTMQGDGVNIDEPPEDADYAGGEDPIFRPLTSFADPGSRRRNYLKRMTGSTLVLGNADAIPETAANQAKGRSLSILLDNMPTIMGNRIVSDIEHKEADGSHELHIHLVPELWNVSELGDLALLRGDIYLMMNDEDGME